MTDNEPTPPVTPRWMLYACGFFALVFFASGTMALYSLFVSSDFDVSKRWLLAIPVAVAFLAGFVFLQPLLENRASRQK